MTTLSEIPRKLVHDIEMQRIVVCGSAVMHQKAKLLWRMKNDSTSWHAFEKATDDLEKATTRMIELEAARTDLEMKFPEIPDPPSKQYTFTAADVGQAVYGTFIDGEWVWTKQKDGGDDSHGGHPRPQGLGSRGARSIRDA